MSWTREEEQTLISLAKKGDLFYSEIAERMGRSPKAVCWKARKLGLPKSLKRMGQWNVQHKELREPVFRYFLNHTFEETMKRFRLTQSQLKSIMTVGYRDPGLKQYRKDKRCKREWSGKDLKYLLRHAGLIPRDEIGRHLGRGKDRVIKEKLQKLGLCSRSLQGITLSQFRQAFGKDPGFYLQTSAGPSRVGVQAPTLWKIVPWVWLDQELKAKRLKAPKVFRRLVATQALFQDWIYEGDTLRKMKKIVRESRR